MSFKPPEQPEDIFDHLLIDLQILLGKNLLGLCVFGPAIQVQYIKGVSVINLLVLMNETFQNKLKKMVLFYQKWGSAYISPPLILTPSFVQNSLDLFPIEYLVMSAGHCHLFGEDPLKDLVLDQKKMYLQLKRELRAKLIAIRTRVLTSGGRWKFLENLVHEALPAFIMLFQTILFFKNNSFPLETDKVLENMIYHGLSVDFFQTLLNFDHNKDIMILWEGALANLETIINFVDKLK